MASGGPLASPLLPARPGPPLTRPPRAGPPCTERGSRVLPPLRTPVPGDRGPRGLPNLCHLRKDLSANAITLGACTSGPGSGG